MAEQTYQDVVCVIGISKDHKPIWKKVGVKTQTKSTGRDVILLDRTFNPAGVAVDEGNKTSVPLYFFEQDTKEQREERQVTYKKGRALDKTFNDFEDDIPF